MTESRWMSKYSGMDVSLVKRRKGIAEGFYVSIAQACKMMWVKQEEEL